MKLKIEGRLYNRQIGYINLDDVTVELVATPADDVSPVALPEALDEARHAVEFGPRACGVDGCSVCRGGL